LGISIIVIGFLVIQGSRNFNWKNYNYNSVESETLKLGFITSLTGQGSSIGERSLISARLAVDTINQSGGINGKVLQLIVEDGKCSSQAAARATQRLIDNGVIGIIGGLCSNESLGFVKLIDEQQIPTISYCSSSPALSGSSEYFFRNFPSDVFQAQYAAQYIKQDLGIDSVTVMYLDDAWGRGLLDEFSNSFSLLEGTISHTYSFTEDTSDFSDIWLDIEEHNPSLIYFLGFDTTTIAALNQLPEYAINSNFFGADGWDDSEMWDRINRGNRTFSYTTPSLSKNEKFQEEIRQRGIYTVSNCIPQAYDAVNIFKQLLSISDPSSENMKLYLQDIVFDNSVTTNGVVEFDASGDLVNVDYTVEFVK